MSTGPFDIAELGLIKIGEAKTIESIASIEKPDQRNRAGGIEQLGQPNKEAEVPIVAPSTAAGVTDDKPANCQIQARGEQL